MAVPHGIDETRLMRNLDIPVPAPIAEHYDFPSADGKRPFDKQVLTAASMTMNTRSFVLNGMGTGKTKSCLWAYDYLRSIGRAKRMIVVCPLSTMEFVWAREIMVTMPQYKVKVLSGSADRRRKRLAETADIYIINHDGLQVIADHLAKRKDIDTWCFDEASAYRNARADRSKLAQKLSKDAPNLWAMTGSPTPTSPTDAFGLAWLVNPKTAPKSFVQFRQSVLLQINQFKWCRAPTRRRR
jgi:SNF2 family DNA or RNA helicase